MTIDELLGITLDVRGSDLHLRAGAPTRARIDGDLQLIADGYRPTADQISDFHRSLRPKIAFNEDDFSFESKGVYWRANTADTLTGPGVVLRQIPASIPPLDQLGVPLALVEKIDELRGLHLVSGPTGSGKTTTLSAIVRYLSRLRIKIITLEDPVEQRHALDTPADIVQRELRSNFTSFADAIRAALRQDPDVLLIGEMRDQETINAALRASETGHMVFSTLHNETAKDAVTRILDAAPDNGRTEQRARVAKELVTVTAQQLVKRRGGGRVAAFELMVNTHPVATLIREGKHDRLYDEIMRGSSAGMQTMNQSLASLARARVVERDAARAASPDPKNFDAIFPQSR